VWGKDGESMIISVASGMSSCAQNLFRQNRIKVVIAVLESDPEKAILSYLNGSLATGDNVCDH
jgi:ATP-binding protein involved in chromosome partitioning